MSSKKKNSHLPYRTLRGALLTVGEYAPLPPLIPVERVDRVFKLLPVPSSLLMLRSSMWRFFIMSVAGMSWLLLVLQLLVPLLSLYLRKAGAVPTSPEGRVLKNENLLDLGRLSLSLFSIAVSISSVKTTLFVLIVSLSFPLDDIVPCLVIQNKVVMFYEANVVCTKNRGSSLFLRFYSYSFLCEPR